LIRILNIQAQPSYRYGFQGQERDDEIKGKGNSYTTLFRLNDVRIGRWFSTDPKYTAFESPYTSMGNNPILNTDVLGDTITVSNDFQNCKSCMEAYNKWSSTKSGQKFLKNYGVGGKYESISIHISNDEKFHGGAEGGTVTSAWNKDGFQRNLIPDPNNEKGFDSKLKKDEYLRIDISLNFDDKRLVKAGDNVSNLGKSRYTQYGADKANMNAKNWAAITIMHESQHAEIITRDFKLYHRFVTHGYYQHHEMRDKSLEWYKNRLEFYKQLYPEKSQQEAERDVNAYAD
jgi:RHS repeat-associated protein